MKTTETIFVKLGGSLITDKTRPYTPRMATIERLATEVRQALDDRPHLQLVIGHGSGSFGHWAAQPYGTRQGVFTPEQWRGYAEVAAAAARLNRIVCDAFLQAGVPVWSLQPSASARCRDGVLFAMETTPLRAALEHRLVPLLYGDVALDDRLGGTIISTEDIFAFLADLFHPVRILLLGEVPGVLSADGALIPHITPANLVTWRKVLGGSRGVDVTGGMMDKVTQMTTLVREHPQTQAYIFSGVEPGTLVRALRDPASIVGTRIAAELEGGHRRETG